MTTITRKSVPLTERDLSFLGKLRESAELRSVLGELAHASVTPDASEAALLRLLIIGGFEAVQDRLDELSYEAEAADLEHSEESRRIARRPRALKGMAAIE